MVKQYLHTANLTYATAATTLLNGDLLPGAEVTGSFKCRAEPKGGGYIMGVGGVKVDFTWMVYASVDVPAVPIGAAIVVRDENGELVCEDTVKRFSKGQFNCRLWL